MIDKMEMAYNLSTSFPPSPLPLFPLFSFVWFWPKWFAIESIWMSLFCLRMCAKWWINAHNGNESKAKERSTQHTHTHTHTRKKMFTSFKWCARSNGQINQQNQHWVERLRTGTGDGMRNRRQSSVNNNKKRREEKKHTTKNQQNYFIEMIFCLTLSFLLVFFLFARMSMIGLFWAWVIVCALAAVTVTASSSSSTAAAAVAMCDIYFDSITF